MRILIIAVTACLVHLAVGLPVTQQKASTEKPAEHQAEEVDMKDVLEYERYLREVVEALESDPEFRKKLDKSPEADIRSGKIAQELEYVNHHVRSKLDEIKRREIERLRTLANKQFELTNEIDRDSLKIGHVQHENEHTFEIEDLKRLILKTSEDLAEADRKRREEFKQYEMQKEFEEQQKLNELDDEHKKKYEEELKQQKEKHNKHEKVHHPGNRAQLEEVWEKQDHMDGMDFDPKIFFKLHDLDGNGYWDENELKALFVKELDKVYKQGLPEDDMRERAEDMERMREHVFKESDTNHDGLISFDEFMAQTKRDDFNRDPGWDTVDNVPQYTHEEFLEFERKRQEEIQKLIASGKLPPHPNMPQGYYPNGQPMHPNQQQQLHYQQQPQYHQQQVYHQQQQQAVYQQQQQAAYQQQQQLYHEEQQKLHQQQQFAQPAGQQQQHPQVGAQGSQQQQQQYQPPPGQQQYQQPGQQAATQQQQPPPQQQQQYQQPGQQAPAQQQQPPPQQQQQQFQQPPPQQQQFQQPPAQQQQQFQQPPPQQQQQQYQQPPPQQQPNQPQNPASNQQQQQQAQQNAEPGVQAISPPANVNAIPANNNQQPKAPVHN